MYIGIEKDRNKNPIFSLTTLSEVSKKKQGFDDKVFFPAQHILDKQLNFWFQVVHFTTEYSHIYLRGQFIGLIRIIF